MSNHNIFSDTELGGKFFFRLVPADTSPVASILGLKDPVDGLSETCGIGALNLRAFLGINGTVNQFAFFGNSNTLSSGLMERNITGAGGALTVDFAADLNLKSSQRFYMQTRSSAGTTPANLQVAAFDGSQLKVIQPPTIVAGKVYYLRIGETGFGWDEQTPGGGTGTPGVPGSGVPDRAARWATSTSITTSNLELTNTFSRFYGDLQVWLNGTEAFALRFSAPSTKQWFVDATYMPEYSGAIASTARVLINDANIIRGAPPGLLRGFIDAYSTSEIQAFLATYLPLAAGTSKPLTGNLAIDKVDPSILLRDTVGNVMGMKNDGGVWSVFTADRSWNALRSGIDYDSSAGSFKVWQLSGTWQAFEVATQSWADSRFALASHTHVPAHTILTGSGVLVGGSTSGPATEVTMGAGMQLVSNVLSTTALVSSVGLSAPAQFTVSGSPVTTLGTLQLSWATVAPNSFLVGPSSGSPLAPNFRTLVLADIPTAALGTGLASFDTVLCGDRQWRTTGDVMGGGAVNRIPKWTGTKILDNSLLWEDRADPTYTNVLHIDGTITASGHLILPTSSQITGGPLNVTTITYGASTKQVLPELPTDFDVSKVWVLVRSGSAWVFRQLTGTGTIVLSP